MAKKKKNIDVIAPVILNMTGMLFLGFLKRVALKGLDRGQMWTFSLVTSAMQYFALVIASDRPFEMIGVHAAINLGVFLVASFLQFGFHIDLLEQLGDDYFR